MSTRAHESSRTGAGARLGAGLRRYGRLAVAAACGVIAALGVASPASAHSTDLAKATDYRIRITAVEPALPGVSVRVVVGEDRLELSNSTDRPVVIMGYKNEPLLRVGPDGGYANTLSPSFDDRLLPGVTTSPGPTDAAAAPQWRKVSDASVLRWHDHRAHWAGTVPPPAVAADPGRFHHIWDWSVPLHDADQTVIVRGTLDWLPAPRTTPWLAGGLLVLTMIAVLGLVPARAGWPVRLLGVPLTLAGLAATGYAAAAAADAARGGWFVGDWWKHFALEQTWALFGGLAALIAGGWALVGRRTDREFSLALAGVGVAVMAGVANADAFLHSVVPVPVEGGWARLAVAATLSLGAGTAAAAALRLRAIGLTGRAATDRAADPDAAADHGAADQDALDQNAVDHANADGTPTITS